MKTVHKSAKLANVCYDIRGPIMDAAKQMEEDGHKIIKLNIGNLAVFGFDAPEEIQQDMIRNLPNSAGYSDSKGIFAARKAVMHETQKQGIKGVTLDDIYLGNGVASRQNFIFSFSMLWFMVGPAHFYPAAFPNATSSNAMTLLIIALVLIAILEINAVGLLGGTATTNKLLWPYESHKNAMITGGVLWLILWIASEVLLK